MDPSGLMLSQSKILRNIKIKVLVVDEADILGYWVYIPRYSYQVMRRDAADKVVTDEEAIAMGGFNIKFETTNDFKRAPKACINSSSSRYYQDCVDTTYPTEGDLPAKLLGPLTPPLAGELSQLVIQNSMASGLASLRRPVQLANQRYYQTRNI